MNLNKMLVLTALAAGGLFACGSAFGQDATTNTTTNATSHNSHMFRGPSIDKLSEELGLTDSQKAQVQSVLTSEHKQMRDLHQDTSLSTDERRSKMGEIRDSVNTQMQSILTSDQYEKWQKLTHSHHATHHTTPMMSTNAPAGSAQ